MNSVKIYADKRKKGMTYCENNDSFKVVRSCWVDFVRNKIILAKATSKIILLSLRLLRSSGLPSSQFSNHYPTYNAEGFSQVICRVLYIF